MKTVIKYIRLPFSFSAGLLAEEMEAVTGEWLLHYNTTAYQGEWKALPLRTMGGSLTQHMSEGDLPFENTVLLDQCPVIKKIMDSFDCEKLSVRLLNLRPGAVVKEHKDPGLSYEEGLARIHIPIQTNSEVSFYVEGEKMDLEPGSCWYINFDLPHWLDNAGTTDRVHLVMDCVVNNWVQELFAGCAEENIKRIPAKEKMTVADRYRMLEHLKAMNTETSLAIAEKLEKELANMQ